MTLLLLLAAIAATVAVCWLMCRADAKQRAAVEAELDALKGKVIGAASEPSVSESAPPPPPTPPPAGAA